MSVMLTMDLKLEPSSPPASLDAEVTWLNEDTLLFPLDQDDFIKHDDFKLEPELFIGDSKAEVASQILENLENLVDLDELIKEDSFFLDVKGIPLLEDVEAPQAVPVVNKDYFKSSDTQIMFNDISNVYEVYKHDTLTPPQSPPSEQPTFLNLEPQGPNFFTLQPTAKTQINPVIVYNVPVGESKTLQTLYSDAKQLYAPEYPAVVTPNPDIAHELAVVDELVRTRVADLQWNNGPSSPSSYTSSSSNSSFGDFSDHEWSPDTAEQSSGSESPSKKGSKKRKTPYARSTEDKKSRKKEQNKNAATRYRLKKKAEVEEILTEEKQLAKHGDELNIKITDLQREIKYLKSLMRDLFKAKGIIN